MIKKIIEGIVIGTANVIPGVSGGTMMVAMGIYDQLIHSITHLRKEFKKSMKFLIPIFIGMGIAIIFVAKILSICFDHYPIQTNLLFCGLIVGGLPFISKHVRGKTIRFGMMITFLVFFALVVGMALVEQTEGVTADTSMSALNAIRLFGVGIVAAATMVIPGVSGSMMLMIMGYYRVILDSVSGMVDSLTSMDMQGITSNLFILIPFGIGVVIGIFLVAKLIEIIFSKAETHAYWGIIGLITASPIAILIKCDWSVFSIWVIPTGVLAFAAGWFIAGKLGH